MKKKTLTCTEKWCWQEFIINPNRPLPSPRAAHTTIAVGTKLLILWGGNDEKFFPELFIIDTSKDEYYYIHLQSLFNRD